MSERNEIVLSVVSHMIKQYPNKSFNELFYIAQTIVMEMK